MEYSWLKEHKKLRYNGNYNMHKDRLIGDGNEGKVYLIKGYAVKFYKPFCKKVRLNKKNAIYLSNLSTKRILTPDDILLNKKREIEGYKTQYVDNLGITNLLYLNKDNLKKELSLLEEDVTVFSDNLVLLDDLSFENASFHNGIYLIDPGSYKFDSSYDKVICYALNMERMDEFLLSQILFVGTCDLTNNRKKYRILKEKILNNYKEKTYPNLLEYLIDDIKEENLGEYIKVKTKN